jgi:hypothetical protein
LDTFPIKIQSYIKLIVVGETDKDKQHGGSVEYCLIQSKHLRDLEINPNKGIVAACSAVLLNDTSGVVMVTVGRFPTGK